ncbi:Fumarate hydratase class II [Serratia rubidaea]|uniref:Fumarate hydratase class II n=1 Tax=Serratia rubidaea TaxID=61652 RepID=A0A447QV68_SERRU|nr:Fumarate hydratase class II [Serratia rubidaea]
MGAQTQRSLEHFHISTEKMPTALIHALALTKRAAAEVNRQLGLLADDRAAAIIQAADEVLAGSIPMNSRSPSGRPAPAPRPI